MMVTVQLTDRQCAMIAAGLAAMLRKQQGGGGGYTAEDLYFMTVDSTLAPLNNGLTSALKDVFYKASSTGIVDQPPQEPPSGGGGTATGMRMRG